MGYLKISNLQKNQDVLLFKEVYVMEKTHGTSAKVLWDKDLSFFSGGAKHESFVAIFDQEKLKTAFLEMGHSQVTIYGEAYGGKEQGMSKTYGPNLSFIAFEVQIGDAWLDVPNSEQVVTRLGLEFVPWKKMSSDIELLKAERDAPSLVAVRRGITEPKMREGIVIRPPIEVTRNNGTRVMAKWVADAFRETTSIRQVKQAQSEQMTNAQAIADEWVTERRVFEHVLAAMNPKLQGKEDTPKAIKAVLEDIRAESEGEIEWSGEVEKAIGRKAAKMFHQWLDKQLETANE